MSDATEKTCGRCAKFFRYVQESDDILDVVRGDKIMSEKRYDEVTSIPACSGFKEITYSCQYTFIGYCGDIRNGKKQSQYTAGELFSTGCGNTVYGPELAKGNCIYCGKPVNAPNIDTFRRKQQ